MKSQEIAPKTLVAILAAQIREESETLAKRIVENAKGNDVDYSQMVEKYVLNKDNSSRVLFSKFSKNAFAEIVAINNEINKVLTFRVSIENEWGRIEKDGKLKPGSQNEFTFSSELDIKQEDRDWNKSIYSSHENIDIAFEAFKRDLKIAIGHPDTLPTEIIIESEEPETI